MTRVELEQEALNLPDAERLELADALVESTVPFALDSTEQTKADRAIASYRADPHGIGWSSVVHSDPGISGGTPVFCGTRVPAKTLFDYLEGGETLDRFLDQFPSVSRAQVLAVLELARRSTLAGARSA